MKKHILILAVMLLAATTAQAGPYCEGMAKADRIQCIASKYDDYAVCQLLKTYDEDVDGVGCCDADYAACREDALAVYTDCRADVDTCAE